MRMLKVLNEKCEPTKGSKFSACIDLSASKDMFIESGETVLIPLGVSIDQEYLKELFTSRFYGQIEFRESNYNTFMSTHYIQLMIRSSLSKQLTIANGVGIIDMDYDDEIMIRVHNHSNTFIEIKEGSRVAQLTLLKHYVKMFGIESEQERNGGFGSTGE